jgi:hypothetical protein
MPNEEMITIKKSLYEKLLRDSKQLSHLNAAGVDNWEGYSYYSSEEDIDEEDEEYE